MIARNLFYLLLYRGIIKYELLHNLTLITLKLISSLAVIFDYHIKVCRSASLLPSRSLFLLDIHLLETSSDSVLTGME
jgi:hypothetical protein